MSKQKAENRQPQQQEQPITVGGLTIHATTAEEEAKSTAASRYDDLVEWFQAQTPQQKFTLAVPVGMKPTSFRSSLLTNARSKGVKLSTAMTADGKSLIVWLEERKQPVVMSKVS